MNVQTKTPDMADLPVQLASNAHTPAEARARFFNSGNAFNIKLPPVPARVFAAELAQARTGFVLCDQSDALGCGFPATTPLMLARYAHIAPADALHANFAATGAIWYVIDGAGTAATGAETIAFAAGDIFLTGGDCALATDTGARLWVVTNEPCLSLDGLLPATPVAPVHYPAAEISRQLATIHAAAQNPETSGMALIFSSAAHEASKNILPSLTLGLNSVPPGEQQRPHRHNSAAITLILRGEHCHSRVAGARCDWQPFATLVTPAGDPHSHHNDGTERALFLIVQDGGLHYHARTMGFAFLDGA
jgi:gentisate 1,2-dioxygenase